MEPSSSGASSSKQVSLSANGSSTKQLRPTNQQPEKAGSPSSAGFKFDVPRELLRACSNKHFPLPDWAVEALQRESPQATEKPSAPQPQSKAKPTTIKYHGGTLVHRTAGLGSSSSHVGFATERLTYTHVNGSQYHLLRPIPGIAESCVISEDASEIQVMEKLDKALERVKADLKKAHARIPGPYLNGTQTLFLKNLDDPDGPTIIFVDYNRCLFIEVLPRNSDVTDLLVEVKTEKFWSMIAAYPMHIPQLPPTVNTDFLAAITFGSYERITEWNHTTFPFTDAQAQRLTRVYQDLIREMESGNREGVRAALYWHIARTMVIIEQARQKSKFGTLDYELYRPVVTAKPSIKVRVYELLLMLVLFGAHKMYRVRLQSTRVKGEVYLADFRELLKTLLAEWTDSNLLATVFVGANVAFLAVPDITSLQRTASLVSAIFALTSVIVGVHHVWQHRSKVNANIDEANKYLLRMHTFNDGQDSDLAMTACFLSFPLVSLLYAVLTFSVALGAFCIQNSDVHSRVLLGILLGLLALSGLVTLLYFWHVWRGPRTAEISDADEDEMAEYGWRTIWKNLRRRMLKRIAQMRGKKTYVLDGDLELADRT